MEELYIGCSPCNEPCVQVNDKKDYYMAMRCEVNIFKRQLERKFPDGLFKMKQENHDFGPYYEVFALWQEDASEGNKHMKAAFDAEANMPENWDEEAKKEIEQLKKEFPADLWG